MLMKIHLLKYTICKPAAKRQFSQTRACIMFFLSAKIIQIRHLIYTYCLLVFIQAAPGKFTALVTGLPSERN